MIPVKAKQARCYYILLCDYYYYHSMQNCTGGRNL